MSSIALMDCAMPVGVVDAGGGDCEDAAGC